MGGSSVRAALAIVLLAVAPATARADAAGASAPEAVIVRVEYDPPTFYPGQAALAYATLDPGTASWGEAVLAVVPGREDGADDGAEGDDEAGPPEVEVLSARLERRGGQPVLIVRFVPWTAGRGRIPGMELGGLSVPGLRFDCASALTSLSPPVPMPQLEPPGLRLRLYLAGGVVLVALLVGLAAAFRAAPWFGAIKARWAAARSRREFDDILESIGSLKPETAAWAALCAAVRRFVGIRTGVDWSAMTASEIALSPEGPVPGPTRDAAAAILSSGDAARFAGLAEASLADAVVAARAVADRLDEAGRAP